MSKSIMSLPKQSSVFSPGFSESMVTNLHNNGHNCYVNAFLLFVQNYDYHALIALGRTLVTSLTTLLVLTTLFFTGGELINGFSKALIIGVIVGTYSSIYVASNMLLGLNIAKEDLMVPEKEGVAFDDGMP